MTVMALRHLCEWIAVACGWPPQVYTSDKPVIRDREKNEIILEGLARFEALPTDLESIEDLLENSTVPVLIVAMVTGDGKYKTSPRHMNNALQLPKFPSSSGIICEIGGALGYTDPAHDVHNAGEIAMKKFVEMKQRHSVLSALAKTMRRPKGTGITRSVRKEFNLIGQGLVITRATSNRYLTHSEKMWRPFSKFFSQIMRICIRADFKQVCHLSK